MAFVFQKRKKKESKVNAASAAWFRVIRCNAVYYCCYSLLNSYCFGCITRQINLTYILFELNNSETKKTINSNRLSVCVNKMRFSCMILQNALFCVLKFFFSFVCLFVSHFFWVLLFQIFCFENIYCLLYEQLEIDVYMYIFEYFLEFRNKNVKLLKLHL